MTDSITSECVQEFYLNSLVWDAHAGVFPDPKVDLSLLNAWYETGVNFVSINVGFDVIGWEQTLATLAAYRRWLLKNNEHFALVSSINDLNHARLNNKLAVAFDIEGMNALNGDINMVSVYYSLGVRQMLFAYNLNNVAAGGCHDSDVGLTGFGSEIVREMNRVGMIVDCSHASYRTTMDIMAESSAPVVFSHSNPLHIWNHQRNITDEQIRACAGTGGVIGTNGMGIFLGENDVSNETLLKHICYVSELVGAEHVGFGFDYSPEIGVDVGTILQSRPDYWPGGQQYDTPQIKHTCPSQLPALVEGLVSCGFSGCEIRGFLGENFCRVAESVWTVETP